MSRYRTAVVNVFAGWEEEFPKITFMTAISNTSPHLKGQVDHPPLRIALPVENSMWECRLAEGIGELPGDFAVEAL